MKTQEINYNLGDQNFKAYVAHPELDKAPLILIAHTWAGKDDFVELKARELAEEGFIAMAVDMYGDGRVGSSTEENQSLMTPLVEDREKLKSVINAALNAGKELEGVDSTKIAAIGYCFGGLVVLDLARSGTDWQLHSFGNAYHAFTNPDADDLDFGVQYNQNADKRSWQSMMNFFSEIF